MRVVVIGTGYVGLVSGACFADIGHDVTCVDKNPAVLERLGRGEMPIYEPGLDAVVARGVEAGRLKFAATPDAAVQKADVVFIAVGTPPDDQGDANLSYVFGAAKEIALALAGYTVVVTKSTVPVGTGRAVAKAIKETAPDADFDIASVPEFLREGSAVADFASPDRIVVGAETERAKSTLRDLHGPLLEGRPDRFVSTQIETSELIKYSANAFLAVKITFINEIADLCERVGANVEDVARGMGLDQRIGRWGLSAGPGYGGSCFPKDTSALAVSAARAGSPAKLVEAAIEVNTARKRALADRVASAVGAGLNGKTVGVLGITFKANTDDVRDSPGIDLVSGLLSAGATVRVFDPQGAEHARALVDGVEWCGDTVEAATAADVVAIATEWDQFKQGELDLAALKSAMAGETLVDFRNLFDPEVVTQAGLSYHSVGRPSAIPQA
jgi:UDPglucose 6-dehydrogenase